MLATDAVKIETQGLPLDAIEAIANGINDKIDIPVIGEMQEEAIFKETIALVANVVLSLLPPSLAQALFSPDKGLEEGYIGMLAERLSGSVAAKVDLPYLLPEQEVAIVKRVCLVLVQFLATGVSL